MPIIVGLVALSACANRRFSKDESGELGSSVVMENSFGKWCKSTLARNAINQSHYEKEYEQLVAFAIRIIIRVSLRRISVGSPALFSGNSWKSVLLARAEDSRAPLGAQVWIRISAHAVPGRRR
jgi:hypothetical protein